MKQLITIVFLIISFNGWSADLENLPKRNWQEINILGGINGNGYLEVEPSYSYMFSRNLGVTGGVNFMFGTADDDKFNNITGEFERKLLDIRTLLFRPAIRFRFPVARQNNAELFALNIEPGLYIPIGSEEYKPNSIADMLGNKKMDWCYLNLKTYLTLDLCPIFLSIGYAVTDFSHKPDQYRLTHSGFIQIGYAF